MANKKSFLKLDSVPIIPSLSIKIPSVGEILEDEQTYYQLTYTLTMSPFSCMVQLDDMGIDYTKITEWELFIQTFQQYINYLKPLDSKVIQLEKELEITSDEFYMQQLQQELTEVNITRDRLWNTSGLDLLFEKTDLGNFTLSIDEERDIMVLYNPVTNAVIDERVYKDIADTIRKINLYEHIKSKPGNESAKKYLLEKERRKLKRNAKKPYKPYLEKLVIALVNNKDFPYDYESCMDLSIYCFNQSLKQIQHNISFDKTMTGVYAGTININKMADKDCLSWIPTK